MIDPKPKRSILKARIRVLEAENARLRRWEDRPGYTGPDGKMLGRGGRPMSRTTPEQRADLARMLDAAMELALTRPTPAESPRPIDPAAERDALAAKVERVRELHRESRGSMSALYPNPICECGKDYPCPTIRALDGEADR